MSDVAKDGQEILFQQDVARQRLSDMGYIWQMQAKTFHTDKGEQLYNLLGDSSRRAIWMTWADQTLAVEQYKDGKWIEKAKLSLALFAALPPMPEFLGDVPDVLRKVAAKLQEGTEGSFSYYFRSPEAGAAEQILYAQTNLGPLRVRVIPGGPDAALLIFEKKLGHNLWQHLHRTTAAKFLGPEYKADVVLESIPSPPPVPGDPDYRRAGLIGSVFRRLVS